MRKGGGERQEDSDDERNKGEMMNEEIRGKGEERKWREVSNEVRREENGMR